MFYSYAVNMCYFTDSSESVNTDESTTRRLTETMTHRPLMIKDEEFDKNLFSATDKDLKGLFNKETTPLQESKDINNEKNMLEKQLFHMNKETESQKNNEDTISQQLMNDLAQKYANSLSIESVTKPHLSEYSYPLKHSMESIGKSNKKTNKSYKSKLVNTEATLDVTKPLPSVKNKYSGKGNTIQSVNIGNIHFNRDDYFENFNPLADNKDDTDEQSVTRVISSKYNEKNLSNLDKMVSDSVTLLNLTKIFNSPSNNIVKSNEKTPSRNVYAPLKNIPDYFNELLIWHSDILHKDNTRAKNWDTVLKAIDYSSEYPSLLAIQNEIDSVNNFLQLPNTYGKETNVKTKFKNYFKLNDNKSNHVTTNKVATEYYNKVNDKPIVKTVSNPNRMLIEGNIEVKPLAPYKKIADSKSTRLNFDYKQSYSSQDDLNKNNRPINNMARKTKDKGKSLLILLNLYYFTIPFIIHSLITNE